MVKQVVFGARSTGNFSYNDCFVTAGYFPFEAVRVKIRAIQRHRHRPATFCPFDKAVNVLDVVQQVRFLHRLAAASKVVDPFDWFLFWFHCFNFSFALRRRIVSRLYSARSRCAISGCFGCVVLFFSGKVQPNRFNASVETFRDSAFIVVATSHQSCHAPASRAKPVPIASIQNCRPLSKSCNPVRQ